MEEFINKIIEHSISIAILFLWILYFIKKTDKKDEKIYELHKEFVDLIKETHKEMNESCKKILEKIDNYTK